MNLTICKKDSVIKVRAILCFMIAVMIEINHNKLTNTSIYSAMHLLLKRVEKWPSACVMRNVCHEEDTRFASDLYLIYKLSPSARVLTIVLKVSEFL